MLPNNAMIVLVLGAAVMAGCKYRLGGNASAADDPKSASIAECQAMMDGDMATVEKYWDLDTPQAHTAAEALVKAVSTTEKVRKAAVARWGEKLPHSSEKGNLLYAQLMIPQNQLAQAKQIADVKMEGDRAILFTPAGERGSVFKKINGQWKEITSGDDIQGLLTQVPIFKDLCRTFEAILPNIGSYKTFDEMAEAWSAESMKWHPRD